MVSQAKPKLTPQESGSLGGLIAAANMSPEARRERASRGGEKLLDEHGKAYFRLMARKRWAKARQEDASK